MAASEANEEVRQVWNTVAPGWDRHRTEVFEQQRTVSERLIEAIGASDGATILELTAGPGETGLLLAELNPGARVIVSDFAPLMVEAATRAAEARKLPNVEVRQIDAQDIDLPDDSVDGVLSRYGLMLIPEPDRAASEIRRVLRPGKPLAYAVWGPLEANPWMMLFGAVFIQRGHFMPEEGGPFSLTTPDENEALLQSAGFSNVEVETVDNTVNFASVEDYWDLTSSVSGPLAVIAQGLPPEEHAELRSLLESFTQGFRTDDGLSMPSQSIFVRAS